MCRGERSEYRLKFLDEKRENGQNESIGQNERNGICRLSNVNEHHCINICNMTVKGSVGTERVYLRLVKWLSRNAKMLVRGTIGTAGYDLS